MSSHLILELLFNNSDWMTSSLHICLQYIFRIRPYFLKQKSSENWLSRNILLWSTLAWTFFWEFWDNVGVAHNVLLIIFKWLSVVVFAILRPYKWVLRPSENICCIIGSLKLKLYELRKETVWFLLTGKLISYWNKKATFLLVFVVFEEMKYKLLYVVGSFISTLKWYFCSLFFWYYITNIRA